MDIYFTLNFDPELKYRVTSHCICMESGNEADVGSTVGSEVAIFVGQRLGFIEGFLVG